MVMSKKREFKKPDEVNDAEERIKMKICEFELWSTMVFMRCSYKIKYGEFIHCFSIQYAIKKRSISKNTIGSSGCYAQSGF